jgi:U4/U6 small nuclear ribonucleoprotein PRP3
MAEITRTRLTGNPAARDGDQIPDQSAIRRLIDETRRKLAERQNQIGNVTAVPSVTAAPLAGPQLDPKARLAELQARLKARSAGLAVLQVPDQTQQQSAGVPVPLILDDEGRTVDRSGNTVTLTQRMPTLKANIRAQKKEQYVKVVKKEPVRDEDEAVSQFADARVPVKDPVRKKRTFKFHEKGEFEEQAKRMRTKAQLEKLQKDIAEKAKKTGISSAARLALLSAIVPKQETRDDEVPEVEWWDSFVMRDQSYAECVANPAPADQKFDGITHLIEHPMQLRPPAEPTKPIPLPIFLTKKEQKKLRRQNRRETWKEKQEKIRLGLEPAPEPKMKLSNMMRVLGHQAVQDPTKIEAVVKQQMAKRQKAHEDANNARKLTVDQKKQKKLKKVKEDTNLGVHVAVYRLLDLHNPAQKFKVEMNAKQLQMTGVIVLYRNINVVVVEGGAKQQKKFKRLMLSRIKWHEDEVSKDGTETGEKVPNRCDLVWEGMAKNRSFGEIKFKIAPNESFARELFKNHSVEQYWHLSFSMTLLETKDI